MPGPIKPKGPFLIQPYPTTRKVAPYPFPKLGLPDCEHDLFSSIAQEHVNIAGTDVDYFHHNVDRATRDPLYDEPLKRVYDGPFRIKAFVAWPDTSPEVRMEGWRTVVNAEAWIARKELEDQHCPAPSETDVLRLWNIPFYADWATDGDNPPNAGYFFDVLNVNDDGHLFDSSQFMGFRLTLKRRTEFTPERRITNT